MPKKADTHIKGLRRSRVRYSCKQEIQVLLNVVNLFPPIDKWINVARPLPFFSPFRGQSKLPDYKKRKFEWQREMFRAGYNLSSTLINKCEQIGFLAIINVEEVQKLESLADGNVYTFYESAAQISEVWFHRYNKIKKIKSFLTELAFISRNFDTANKEMCDLGLIGLNHLTTNLRVNENGILQRNESIVVQWLIGVDVRRIRQCAICRNLFWANRLDKRCCRKKCADVHNQRNSREKKQLHGLLYKEAAKRKKK